MPLNIQYEDILQGLRLRHKELSEEIDRVETAIKTLGGEVTPRILTPDLLFRAESVTAPSPYVEKAGLESKTTARISHRNRNSPVPSPPGQPDHGSRPQEAGVDWVSMRATDASPFALCLAILRSHPKDTITSAELNAALGEVRGVKGGAGYTTLEPLQKAGVIAGENGLWRILDRSQGGLIAGVWLWSNPKFLNNYDWAAVRREAILLLLQENPETTNAAITKSLLRCKWLKSPVDPHLVKADLRSLEKDRIVSQNYETRTWRILNQEVSN